MNRSQSGSAAAGQRSERRGRDRRLGERRLSDRRKGDRRKAVRPPASSRPFDESWFGVLGVAPDTQMRLEEAGGIESMLDTDWADAAELDWRAMSRQVSSLRW